MLPDEQRAHISHLRTRVCVCALLRDPRTCIHLRYTSNIKST